MLDESEPRPAAAGAVLGDGWPEPFSGAGADSGEVGSDPGSRVWMCDVWLHLWGCHMCEAV